MALFHVFYVPMRLPSEETVAELSVELPLARVYKIEMAEQS